MFAITIHWGRNGRYGERSLALPSRPGDIRGEVDPSMTEPAYQVQHVVVDTADGKLVTAPSADCKRAEDVARRLNEALVEE